MAAQRAMGDPLFLGYDLREYCQVSGLSELDLPRALDCSTRSVQRLSLCFRPSPDSWAFRADVERIAQHCGIESSKLVSMLRELDSVRAMRNLSGAALHSHAGRDPLLLAARDRPNFSKRRAYKDGKKKGS